MEPLKGALEPFVPTLLTTFLGLIKDDDEDVRNNAVFGLGELALHGGGGLHEHFQHITSQLASLLQQEDHPRVKDQIVGAMCRLMLAGREICPPREVLPMVIRHLPLREDCEEYLAVFQAIMHLNLNGDPTAASVMPEVLALVAKEWPRLAPEATEGIYGPPPVRGSELGPTEETAAALVRSYYQDRQAEFTVAANALPPESAQVIAKIIS
jgi:hypothetical protein